MWASVGFEFGRYVYTDTNERLTKNTSLNAPGIGMNSYFFNEKRNIGLYSHGSFLIPLNNTYSFQDDETEIKFNLLQIGFILGPGFRFNIKERSSAYIGIGVSLMETMGGYGGLFSMDNDVYRILSLNLGISVDIGYKRDLSKDYFISFGAVTNYDVLNTASVTSSTYTETGWIKDRFSLASIRPYLMIGKNTKRKSFWHK